jgi:hypothetical protein
LNPILILSFRTGGLVALGLTTQSWTIEDCLSHFEQLCSKAFPHYTKRGVPVLAWIREKYKSKSEATAFEIALRGAFSETQHLFGDPRPSGKPGSHIKVAVTATSSAGRTVLLGNYNRYASKKRRYLFLVSLTASLNLISKQFGITFAAPRRSKQS